MKKFTILLLFTFYIFHFATAQNVGIGTTSPQKLLSVNGSVVVDQGNSNTGTSSTGALSFGSLSGEAIGSKRNSGTGQFGLDFYTNGINRMTVSNSGNVGINIINPSSKLEIRGALGFSSTTKRWEMNYDSTNGYFYIDEYGSGRRLYIKNGGNVGINTSNPQTTLDVNGDVNIENKLLINNSAGNDGQVLVSSGMASAPTWQNIAYSNNDRFLYISDAASELFLKDTLLYNTSYANSSAISYSYFNRYFTVNKSGLYRFEGAIMPHITMSNSSTIPNMSCRIVFDNPELLYYIYRGGLTNIGNNTWEHTESFGFQIHLTAGQIFYVYTGDINANGAGSITSKSMKKCNLAINLVSE